MQEKQLILTWQWHLGSCSKHSQASLIPPDIHITAVLLQKDRPLLLEKVCTAQPLAAAHTCWWPPIFCLAIGALSVSILGDLVGLLLSGVLISQEYHTPSQHIPFPKFGLEISGNCISICTYEWPRHSVIQKGMLGDPVLPGHSTSSSLHWTLKLIYLYSYVWYMYETENMLMY